MSIHSKAKAVSFAGVLRIPGLVALMLAGLFALTLALSGCQQAQRDSSGPGAAPESSASQGAATPAVPPREEGVVKPPPAPPAEPSSAATPPKRAIHRRGEKLKPGTTLGKGITAGQKSKATSAENSADDSKTMDDALARLKPGNLAYNTPERMKMSSTARVLARIASDAVSAEALRAGMPTDAGTQTAMAPTSITPKMKMTLGSADFTITPLSSDEQMVGGSMPTTWTWDIAPKHSGALHLHLAAVIELNGVAKDFTTVDREIAVQVDPADAVGDFIRTNWQWLIATLTAIVGTAWKFFSSRRKTRAAAVEGPPSK